MKGDISRDTFFRENRYSRVLLQQGRLLLDSDWNEQVSIVQEHIRALTADLIGPHGGPDDGFLITAAEDAVCDVEIGWGRYYVEGMACESLPPTPCPGQDEPGRLRYTAQPDYPMSPEGDPAKLLPGGRYLIYLDVWDRHLDRLQAAGLPSVTPDTATRIKVVWQVKAVSLESLDSTNLTCDEVLDSLVGSTLRLPRCMRARARAETAAADAETLHSAAKYRGTENRLYRVEIHHGGSTASESGTQPTFKWSRSNGSAVVGIRSLEGSVATLDSTASDVTRGLAAGDWVEIVDDVSELRAQPRLLREISAVNPDTNTVTLADRPGDVLPAYDESAAVHPLLRRWDQRSDAIPLEEYEWIELEDGVQIRFEQGGTYQVGDYWQIPASVESADVLWPQSTGRGGESDAAALPPRGITHRVAPLRFIEVDDGGRVECGDDCRRIFSPLSAPTPGPGRGRGNDRKKGRRRP